MVKIRKVDLSTWQIEDVLKDFGVLENTINGQCAAAALDDEKCEGGFGYDVGMILSSDNERITVYYCKECGRFSYYINEVKNDD